jgi:hypothetical protein
MTWLAAAPATAAAGVPQRVGLRRERRHQTPLLSRQAHLHHLHRRVNAGWTADTGMLGAPHISHPAVNRQTGSPATRPTKTARRLPQKPDPTQHVAGQTINP